MSLSVALTHRTRYRYDRIIGLGPQVIRLRPAPHTRTPVLSYALSIKPEGHFINWLQDPHSNYLARVVFPEKVDHLDISVDLVVEWAVQNPFDFFLEPSARTYPFSYDAPTEQALKPYLELATPSDTPLLSKWVESVDDRDVPVVDFLVGLNQRLAGDIKYLVRMEPGVQTPEQTLALARGSCRDSGWLLVEILRRLGLAARFVSGYLIQLAPDVVDDTETGGVTSDFTDLHAWVEVYLPGAGWVGLDPTSGLLAGEGHIPLAATPEPGSAAPITGTADAAEVEFDFDMAVSRIRESPRVTKPFLESEWESIDRLGNEVDARLQADDVRLTMGGEPTFVAVNDAEAAEWNIAAVGPTKRQYAEALIRRLRKRFAPQGMLHFGQGKWYPGEPLPRWSFSLYWRKDQEPVWQDARLIAPESVKAEPGQESESATEPDVSEAQSLLQHLAATVGVNAGHVQPVFEDPIHFLQREQQLPENVDPFNSKLEDPLERARLARVFSHGLGRPSGYILPIQRWNSRAGSGWISHAWKVRGERLLLTPGDSPIGFRLPLQSLPHLEDAEYPFIYPQDPFTPAPPLQSRADWRQHYQRRNAARTQDNRHQKRTEQTAFGTGGGKKRAVRTALAIEPRDGRLCVFMPPTESAEDYLALIAAIEESVAALGLQVHIEGYEPPADSRVNVIKVTPDPGVVEVNIHPAHSWKELVDITLGLDEDARKLRLGTEKFMVDGRHTGTGGGSHMVLGGARAEDSPFLRRPDLLKSLLLFWQNHPALSYLFSGLFIGPTSQAPRIDEARMDSLYELAIAFKQVSNPSAGEDAPEPWLVDRLFRHLLTDVTGNTHRAEICIDKLYSPDGPAGRLGLVEFRGFEMPPHPRMNLVQQLLLRALVAWFWRQPYDGTLTHWGTDLHDRFMLRHFVWEDMSDVVSALQNNGFGFDLAWFQPQLDFRFPHLGEIHYREMTLTLHQALEPWHVLGEEGSIGGTVRYVDSSLERVQVTVAGFAPDRYKITCNSVEVPLSRTAAAGTYVAGIRYRAWPLESALHPTIPVHAPLAIDIYDTWSQRAVAGCTYHVMHPGGRNFDDVPVNAYAAESRRRSRFFDIGDRNGGYVPKKSPQTRDFPLTLDLRLC